jgi:hypothetical protein
MNCEWAGLGTTEDGEEAEVGSEVFGAGGNREKRFGDGAKQDVVCHFFVVKGDLRDGFRQREDGVEVLCRQEFFLPVLEPLQTLCTLAFGAVAVAAGVVGVGRVGAVAAGFDPAAESRRAADLDGAHDG